MAPRLLLGMAGILQARGALRAGRRGGTKTGPFNTPAHVKMYDEAMKRRKGTLRMGRHAAVR